MSDLMTLRGRLEARDLDAAKAAAATAASTVPPMS